MRSLNRNAIGLFLFFVFIYSIQVLPRLSADSLTNDEPTEITNGYYYLTQGDVITPHLHPPLAAALSALPLLALKLKTLPHSGDVIDRAFLFMFDWNRDQIAAITLWSRSVSWLFGLLMGFLLFWITRANFKLCVAALFLWAFDPTFLAMAGVAKIEVIPTFFFFLAVWCFAESSKRPSARLYFLTGSIAAMAVTSKYYALVLAPVFFMLELMSIRALRGTPIKGRWGWGFAGFLSFVALLYIPVLVLSPFHAASFFTPFEKLLEDLVFAQHPFPVYFLGRSGLVSHWYYFPIAFVLKEPLPFLLLIGVTAGLALSKQIKIASWQWIPVVLFTLAILPATNLGVRYLLPLYPFLFLIAAQGMVWLWEAGKQKRSFYWIVGGLVLWQAVSVAFNFPHELSYFNELVPSDKKIYCLADSNLDWGQDSRRLVEESQKRNWGKVKLAYLGGIDPHIYGLDWEPFEPKDLENAQPGWVYVMNASFYQLAPTAFPSTIPIVKSWITQREPTGKVGDSWYYFEVPGKKTENKTGKWLPSVPFLQYRGYCAYPLNPRE